MSYSNTFNIFGHEIEISADLYIGGIGVGAEMDLTNGKYKVTPPMLGLGTSYGIDFS